MISEQKGGKAATWRGVRGCRVELIFEQGLKGWKLGCQGRAFQGEAQLCRGRVSRKCRDWWTFGIANNLGYEEAGGREAGRGGRGENEVRIVKGPGCQAEKCPAGSRAVKGC